MYFVMLYIVRLSWTFGLFIFSSKSTFHDRLSTVDHVFVFVTFRKKENSFIPIMKVNHDM
jgi:hypothetical protein